MKKFDSFLWSSSIALSWLWGLGLFFSVEMSVMFGMAGLLGFVIPNCLGLILFGHFVQKIAVKQDTAEALESLFLKHAKKLRVIFMFYQVVAVSLCVFALLKYAILPVGSVVVLVAILFLGLALWVGDVYDIRGIKNIHGFYLAGIILCMGAIYLFRVMPEPASLQKIGFYSPFIRPDTLVYFSYMLPIIIGLLVGPWLDLQQWQRAIQIRREKGSISKCYWGGSIIFFGLIVFHGVLALWVAGQVDVDAMVSTIPSQHIVNAHEIITSYFFDSAGGGQSAALWCYLGFIALAIISTLDSAYLASKWFLAENVRTSNSVLVSFIPKPLLTSPLPWAILAGTIGIVTSLLQVELEYFMVFYATFFVGYSIIFFVATVYDAKIVQPLLQVFAIALVSLAVFAFGYFSLNHYSWLMIVGSAIPVVTTLFMVSRSKNSPMIEVRERITELRENVTKEVAAMATQAISNVTTQSEPAVPAGSGPGHSTWFEGKWFVYSFVTTYCDTNSVGNVYFANYAKWVGATRELFFQHAMPSFDLKTTDFFILTREFTHKFVRETKEFQRVFVKIRVGSYNRKFVVLEHIITDGEGKTVGKGEQSLMFVSSKDYSLIDIPAMAHTSFAPYV